MDLLKNSTILEVHEDHLNQLCKPLLRLFTHVFASFAI